MSCIGRERGLAHDALWRTCGRRWRRGGRSPSSASPVHSSPASAYSACRSPAKSSRGGNRSGRRRPACAAASLPRRSAMSLFSDGQPGLRLVGHGVALLVIPRKWRGFSTATACIQFCSHIKSGLRIPARGDDSWSRIAAFDPASSPDFRLASTNSSRSPSSTFCVSLRSTPVRRS